MNSIEIFVLCIFAFVSVLYISSRWKEAVKKRDADWMFRPLAGVFDDEHQKPSAFPYLFK